MTITWKQALPWGERGLVGLGLALLLLAPLVVTPEAFFPFVSGKALYARAAIEVIVVAWVLAWVWRGNRPPRSWVLGAFALYVVLSFASAVQGASVTRSLWSNFERMLGVWDLLHWFLLVVALASILQNDRWWRALLNGYLGVVLLLSLIAVSQVWGGPLPDYLHRGGRVDATLGNPSYLAALLAVAIPLYVGFLVRSLRRAQGGALRQAQGSARGRFSVGGGRSAGPPSAVPRRSPQAGPGRRQVPETVWRVFWAGGAALALWALFETGTRGALAGMVGAALAAPVALLVWGNRRALRPVALGSAGILAGTVLLFLMDVAGYFPAPGEEGGGEQLASRRLVGTEISEGSVAVRLASVRVGITALADRPLLGWGPQNYAAAFDRHAGASFFEMTTGYLDQAHNQVVEEFVTRGALGGVAYLALWVALAWAVVRRRREVREEVLAYAVLGGLAAYFIQNLFLFDTPATRLPLSLLAGWVVFQERPGMSGGDPPESAGQASQGREEDAGGSVGLRSPALRVGVSVAVVVVVALSLYRFHYEPYAAARDFANALRGDRPAVEEAVRARQAVSQAPELATLPRAKLFGRMTERWDEVDPGDREPLLRLLAREGDLAANAEPANARVLVTVISLLQRAAPSAESLAGVEPLLEQLRAAAPNRLQTWQVVARQAFLRGDYRRACELMNNYLARAPGTEEHFDALQEALAEELPAGCR